MAATSKFITNPPRVRAFGNAQDVANNTWTRANLPAADGTDYESMRQATGLKIPTVGRYAVSFGISFAGNSNGIRFAQVRRNAGGNVNAGVGVMAVNCPAPGSNTAYLTGACDVPAASVGDVLELFALHGAGTTLAISVWLCARWVALD